MRRLILGAAALTALPLLAFQALNLPELPAPVELPSVKGGMVILETIRLASVITATRTA